MTKEDDLKASIQETVKNVVNGVVGGIVYRIVKASTKKALKKLKEKSFQELKSRLKDVAESELEEQLNKCVEQVTKEITEAGAEKSDFTQTIEHAFEHDFQKYLSSKASKPFPLKPVVITCVSIIVIGGGLFALLTGGDEVPPAPSPPRELPAPQPEPPPLVELPPEEPPPREPPPEEPPPVEPPPEEPPPVEPPPPTPESDLTIIRVWHEQEGADTLIFYEIANDGEAEVGESITHLFLDGMFYMKGPAPPLPPGGGAIEFFNLGELTGDAYNVSLCADGDSWIVESNEGNNCREYGWEQPQPLKTLYTWRADSTVGPTQDKRVRQAICMTINEEDITAKLLWDTGGVFYPEENLTWIYNDQEWSCQDTNVELAYQLLAEAGYPVGFPVIVAAAPFGDELLHAIVELAQAYLSQVNIEFEYVEFFYNAGEIPANEYHLVFKRVE